ncbi:MAG: hypothetical protein Q8S73_20465 [Deltaproteobacteria bacterium]|nr:hypothetical protein [Myxococcales bacterium]MDP3216494.1 hypothetical protein [Deltaproteobacteria bacterium]
MTTWQLFVDESGAFDGPNPSRVAGVLIRGYDNHAAQARERLEIDAFPGSPYPPHERLHNHLSSRAAFGMLPEGEFSLAQRAGLPAVRGRIGRALARFRSATDPRPQRLNERASTAAPQWHPADSENERAVRDSEGWLLDPARAAENVFARAELQQERSRDLIAMRHYGAHAVTLFGGNQACVVAMVRPAGARRGAGDPYLGCLEGLFSRVWLLLSLYEESHHVVLAHVAPRDIRAPGAVGPGDMTVNKLRDAIKRARDRLGPSTALDRVSLIPNNPRPYLNAVHPGVVLADFAAFHLLAPLASGRNGWTTVASEVQAATGLQPELPIGGGRSLSTIGVMGPSEDAILDAARGLLVGPLDPTTAAWEREQATRWIETLGGAQ